MRLCDVPGGQGKGTYEEWQEGGKNDDNNDDDDECPQT
jgi:hypothetical protein